MTGDERLHAQPIYHCTNITTTDKLVILDMEVKGMHRIDDIDCTIAISKEKLRSFIKDFLEEDN